MDAVELPLPVNVQIDKFMASDGSDRVGEVDVKSSVLQKGSQCAPSCAENVSSSRNKEVDNDYYMHENTTSFSVYGDHNKGDHLELNDEGVLLPPNNKGKFSRRKSAKKLVNTSFKRLYDDESECCKKNAGNFGRQAISNEVECDSSRCTFHDKNLIPKQRRVHDGKRIDKKNFRSTLKNKYECLISKTALSCGDTFASGNTIADLHDFAKHLDELSLSQLLDGSYKYLKLTLEKGKKSSVVNDSILLSVRKACSILLPPTFSAAEKTNNLKESQSSQDPSVFLGSSSDWETKDHAESLLKPKAQNSFHENILGSTVLHPKKVVNQLTLPAAHELEDLLLNSSVSSTPPQIKNAKSYTMTSIPSYHWSFYHGGNSKPTIEFCKSSSAKSTSQGKWIRIGSSCTTIENDKNFLSGLVFKYECDEGFIKQQKISGILQDIKSFTPTFKPPSDGSSIKSMGTCLDVEIPNFIESVNRSGIPCPFKSRMFQHHGGAHTSNRHCLEAEFIYHTSRESTASEVVSICNGNNISLDPSRFNLSRKDKTDVNESPTGSVCCCSMSCSWKAKSNEPGCRSGQWSTWEKYRQDFSSEMFSAAIILSGMADCSDATKAAKTNNGKIRWPKTPSMKTMRARKSSHSMDKQDGFSADARHDDLIKRARIQSAKRAEFLHHPPRCSSTHLGAASFPSRSEKHLSQANPIQAPLSTQFSSRADKACDQVSKMPAKPPSAAPGGSYIKDWIRSRSKKL